TIVLYMWPSRPPSSFFPQCSLLRPKRKVNRITVRGSSVRPRRLFLSEKGCDKMKGGQSVREGCIAMAKKKMSYYERSKREQQQPVNKKALITIGAVFAAIVIIMTVLLIVQS